MAFQTDALVARKYKIIERIGNGKFGFVYKGVNITSTEPVALKFEDKGTVFKLLKRETTILNYLYNHKCRNIPSVYWFGQYDDYIGTVMPYYDCSLHEYCKLKTISENKLNTLMVKCVQILESIHMNMVIHRDIKPHNFMVKNGDIFLIDFGLATFYLTEDKLHVTNVTSEHITGTPRYISHHIHTGCTPSRRDDLISLGYIYIYIYAKELPWDSVMTDITISTLTDESHIMHSKNQQRMILKTHDQLIPVCKQINECIENYFILCNAYDYVDDPHYNSLCSLFISKS